MKILKGVLLAWWVAIYKNATVWCNGVLATDTSLQKAVVADGADIVYCRFGESMSSRVSHLDALRACSHNYPLCRPPLLNSARSFLGISNLFMYQVNRAQLRGLARWRYRVSASTAFGHTPWSVILTIDARLTLSLYFDSNYVYRKHVLAWCFVLIAQKFWIRQLFKLFVFFPARVWYVWHSPHRLTYPCSMIPHWPLPTAFLSGTLPLTLRLLAGCLSAKFEQAFWRFVSAWFNTHLYLIWRPFFLGWCFARARVALRASVVCAPCARLAQNWTGTHLGYVLSGPVSIFAHCLFAGHYHRLGPSVFVFLYSFVGVSALLIGRCLMIPALHTLPRFHADNRVFDGRILAWCFSPVTTHFNFNPPYLRTGAVGVLRAPAPPESPTLDGHDALI